MASTLVRARSKRPWPRRFQPPRSRLPRARRRRPRRRGARSRRGARGRASPRPPRHRPRARSQREAATWRSPPRGRGIDIAARPAGIGRDVPAEPAAGNPAPAYPVAARRAGREGRAVLRVVVSSTGEGREIRIAESSGTPSLDEAALAAVRHWRFTPARRNGEAAEDVVLVPVSFTLLQ